MKFNFYIDKNLVKLAMPNAKQKFLLSFPNEKLIMKKAINQTLKQLKLD